MALCFPRFRTVISFFTVALGLRTALALRGEDTQESHAQLAIHVDPSDPSGDSEKSDLEARVMEAPEEETPEDLQSLDEFLDGRSSDEDEDELEWSPEELDEIMKEQAKDNADKAEKTEKLDLLSPEEIEDLLGDVDNEVGLEEEEGDQDQDQDDEACTFSSDSENLMDWLRATKKSRTDGCQER
eukprot:s5_g69.t1